MGKRSGGEGKGCREGEKGREGAPKSWLTPHIPNPEKYPGCYVS